MIVANDSITVSNINDGTITHTAYAYSADGTDRFTTVYPNLNLLKGSSAKTKDGFFKNFNKVENDYGEITIKGTNTWVSRDISDGFSIKPRDYNPNDKYTMSMDVMFTSWNLPAGTTLTEFWLGQRYNKSSDGKITSWKQISFINLPRDPSKMLNQWIRITQTSTIPSYADPSVNTEAIFLTKFTGPSEGSFTVRIRKPKQEPGSTATPWMPSASEVTTADWPSYIGQYSDFTSTASTDPAKYAPWIVFKGGDGTGIQTTTITYAGSTSGTTAPTSGWTSTIPTVPAGSYLWTKTVWTYTDNTSETGYSVAKMGNNGAPGSNGAPGKVVSDTEPISLFKGLTWKYSGTANLTASDGTVINPNTEYFYNGTHWVINYFSVNNFASESITSDKINGKNLTITNGEFISNTTNGPVSTSTEIKDNHIAISKTDGTVNTRNDIALDSEQGLAQKFTNINTGFYRTAGINYQGPFTSDSDGNYAQLTPQGTKLSTDIPWTKLSLMNNFTGNIEYAIINGTVYISASGVGVPAMTAGQWKQAAQLPTGSSAIPIRANRIAAGDSGDGLSWALLSNQAGGIFIRCSANKAPTANLFNATLPYPIG
ncbi:hypothetical protein FO444_04840 [Lactococcus lactis subsp. lactis]|nr:hypothetical protein FO444_04840 [Lactococcus lactis subsp. lactis]